MKCHSCNHELQENEAFCTMCGAPQSNQGSQGSPTPEPPPRKMNIKLLLLITGIVFVLFCAVIVGWTFLANPAKEAAAPTTTPSATATTPSATTEAIHDKTEATEATTVTTTALAEKPTTQPAEETTPATSAEIALEDISVFSEIVTDYDAAAYSLGVVATYDSTLLWEHTSEVTPISELETVQAIGTIENQYWYIAGGTIYALDILTGEIAWENAEFGGASASFSHNTEWGVVAFAGTYGPDLFVVDYQGTTIGNFDKLGDEDTFWPNSINAYGEGIYVVQYASNDAIISAQILDNELNIIEAYIPDDPQVYGVSHIAHDYYFDDMFMHLLYQGVAEDGTVVWEYLSDGGMRGDVDPVAPISVVGNTVYLLDPSGIIGLDVQTGAEVFRNMDFVGNSAITFAFDTDNNLFISCMYGGDELFIMDSYGNTVMHYPRIVQEEYLISPRINRSFPDLGIVEFLYLHTESGEDIVIQFDYVNAVYSEGYVPVQ